MYKYIYILHIHTCKSIYIIYTHIQIHVCMYVHIGALCGVCVVEHDSTHTLEEIATLAPQQRDTLSTMHSELERVQAETQQCIDKVVKMMEGESP